MRKFVFPSRIAISVTIFMGINIAIKILVYPFIVYRFDGLVFEIFLMFLSSLLVRYLMIKFYDIIKLDLFLIENLKSKNQKKGKENNITRRIKKMKAIGNTILLLVLLFTDPVITVLYYRPENFSWNGIAGTRTKVLFVTSTLLCVLVIGTGISLGFSFLN